MKSTTSDGIDALTSGGGTIQVAVAGDITNGNGGGDDGIVAITTGGGAITITQSAGSTITTSGNGIEAQVQGGFNEIITINANGTITNTLLPVLVNLGTPENNESGI